MSRMDLAPDSDPETLATSPIPAFQSQSPVDQSDIEDYLNTYQYASEPSYFTRSNRYHGPPSTWRSWTANDRAVAESLDLKRASDLSIHLYNAFDLKRRSDSAHRFRNYEAKTHSRNGIASDDDQQVANQEFTPPEVWTAWPLRSRYVPRSEFEDAGDHSRITGRKTKPSTSLEDALLATTLRHARQRWEARKGELNHTPAASTARNWKFEKESTKKVLELSATTKDEQHNPASPPSTGRDDTTESEEDSNASDAALMSPNLPEGIQFFSSQAFAAADSSSSSEDDVSTTKSEEDCPVFSADDDSAYNILRPATRHLLVKLDDLLDGLHKARAAYATKGGNTSSRSRSRTAFSDIEKTEDERFVRSGSRAAVKKGGKKRKRSSHPPDAEQPKQSTSRGRSTVRVSDKKNQAYGLRDWSDVLGMAALTGWSIETVARASERCARLFDQNMTFRTFHQGSMDGASAPHAESWFEDEVAHDSTTSEADANIPSKTSPSKIRPDNRQIIECIRASSKCPRCQLHKIQCRPLKPVSAVDFTQPVPCASCSSISALAAPCPGIMIRPKSKPTAKTCPYPNCARYDTTKPFAKNYHLQRHLTDVHGHVYSPPGSPITKTPVHDDRFHLTAEEQLRPSTTFTCPIASCPHHTRAYKRSTRLYDHIRRAHPEFDVRSFKKIVARTGGRGRYDRSRSRSRGQTTVQDGDGGVVDPVDEYEYEKQSEHEVEYPKDSENGIEHDKEDSLE